MIRNRLLTALFFTCIYLLCSFVFPYRAQAEVDRYGNVIDWDTSAATTGEDNELSDEKAYTDITGKTVEDANGVTGAALIKDDLSAEEESLTEDAAEDSEYGTSTSLKSYAEKPVPTKAESISGKNALRHMIPVIVLVATALSGIILMFCLAR